MEFSAITRLKCGGAQDARAAASGEFAVVAAGFGFSLALALITCRLMNHVTIARTTAMPTTEPSAMFINRKNAAPLSVVTENGEASGFSVCTLMPGTADAPC